MDDVLCDYTKAHKASLLNQTEVEFPQSIKGFFENLKPIKGAIESVEILRNNEDCDVYILTAPSTRNPLSYTEKRLWIENHFDYAFTEKLIICSNKGLLKGDFLIDDYNCGKGQETFEGELIQFGTGPYLTWEHTMNYIRTKICTE